MPTSRDQAIFVWTTTTMTTITDYFTPCACARGNKDDSNIDRSIKSCPCQYLFSNQFLIASCTRVNVVIFCRHSIIQGSDSSPHESHRARQLFCHSFLAVMASNYTFMNYDSSGLHTSRLQTCRFG